jgi:hypothetical protein
LSESGGKLGFEPAQTLLVRQVLEYPMMVHVERHIRHRLRNRHNVLSERVGDTGLIHDVGILTREVDNNDLRAKNEIENILNDGAFFPDAVRAETAKACGLAGPSNSCGASIRTIAKQLGVGVGTVTRTLRERSTIT